MNKLSISKEQLKEWVSQLDSNGGCDATYRELEALILQSLNAMEGKQATSMSVEEAIEEAFVSVCEFHPDSKNILKEARKYIASMQESKSESLNYFKTREDYPGWFENEEQKAAAEKAILGNLEEVCRTVTVKLPYVAEPIYFAPWVAKAFYQFHKDTVDSCVKAFSEACNEADVKLEVIYK